MEKQLFEHASSEAILTLLIVINFLVIIFLD